MRRSKGGVRQTKLYRQGCSQRSVQGGLLEDGDQLFESADARGNVGSEGLQDQPQDP